MTLYLYMTLYDIMTLYLYIIALYDTMKQCSVT